MERSEQLNFCKICLNKKRDFKRGLVCNLTDQPASFETECAEFKRDYDVVLEEDTSVEQKTETGNNDILYGSLWFFGGLIATFANFGYVFWGAIVFGAIQMYKGLNERLKL